ncbi:unnamed protein product [Lymnaea stagnalis]|uniref:Peptidase A1 domain-containing protein n=1 Tax=Lymnaea stagnalis TaxID=6523 RepID=A0AAV2HGW9_LYMST
MLPPYFSNCDIRAFISQIAGLFVQYKWHCMQSHFSIACVVILLLHTLVPSCAGVVYRFPVRRFHSQVVMAKDDSNAALKSQLRIVQRDLSSGDLNDMKNNLNGFSGDGYYIDLNIGTPNQTMQVLIDTGSANFAIAASFDPKVRKFFHRENSSTYVQIGTEVHVAYTEGQWTGVLGTDIVSVSSSPNISARAHIACITQTKDFFIPEAEWQGILGLGYSQLSMPDRSILPFWDSVVQERKVLDDIFSMHLCGSSFSHTDEEALMEGSLIFGGVIESLSRGPILYTPIIKQWYYEVVLTDIKVSGKSLKMKCKEFNFDKTIVDSGTTNIRLPTKVFQAVVDAIGQHIETNGLDNFVGASFYNGIDVLCLQNVADFFSSFPIVSFSLYASENSSFQLDLSPQHYLRPVQTDMADLMLQSCVKFGFSSSSSGTVLGAVLMEAFYVVFDRNSSRIGFGQTTCPLPNPKNPVLDITIHGPFYSNKNFSECAYKKSDSVDRSFLIISYIMAGLSIVVALPLFILCFLWIRRKVTVQDEGDTSETQSVLPS